MLTIRLHLERLKIIPRIAESADKDLLDLAQAAGIDAYTVWP